MCVNVKCGNFQHGRKVNGSNVNGFLKKGSGNIQTERVRNEWIRQIMRADQIVIDKRQFVWYRHVLKIKDKIPNNANLTKKRKVTWLESHN